MSGWILLAIGLAAAALDFLIGASWSRRAQDRLAGAPEDRSGETEALARLGRILMLVSPLFLLPFALVAFGIVPVGGVEPIAFN